MLTGSENGSAGIRLALRGRALTATRIAAAIWVAGWLVTAAAGVSQGVLYGWSVLGVLALGLWMVVGAVSLTAILWAAVGRPELVTVQRGALVIRRGFGPFARTHVFDGSGVRALRALEAASPLRAEYVAIQRFWDRGAGRIGFDVNGRTYAFGALLDDETVDSVVAALAAHLPGAIVQPEDGAQGTAASRYRPGWAAYVTRWVLLGALLIPARTFVGDLPICTGAALAGAYEPLDPRDLRADGRVLLVPLGGFPPASAHQIAEHFRLKYALDVDVSRAIPLPQGAWDPAREQLNSRSLLDALAKLSPGTRPRTVVIGLTTGDMFMPGVAWRYAFSHRESPRLAVVSSARMDRGCMGVLPASQPTRLARVRKMVGKNVGILVYGLPLSPHPRSLLYASVGGPQDLDTMGDDF